MGGTSLRYCKVSYAVFIVVQNFCMKCIYHFDRFTFFIFVILKVYFTKYSNTSIIFLIIFEMCFLIISTTQFIIFLINHFPD